MEVYPHATHVRFIPAQPQPTEPEDVAAFVRSSILPAHLDRLAPERREPFATRVLERAEPPLDYVRLNVSATLAAR